MPVASAYRLAHAIVTTVAVIMFPLGATLAQSLTGSGEWQSLSGEAIKGTWTAVLTRRGDIVDGSFELIGSNVLLRGTVSGSMGGSAVLLGVAKDGVKEATFSGKLDGNSVSGEWEYPGLSDRGVWYGTLSTHSAED